MPLTRYALMPDNVAMPKKRVKGRDIIYIVSHPNSPSFSIFFLDLLKGAADPSTDVQLSVIKAA